MIMDKNNEFADNVSAIQETGTANFGDVIDLGQSGVNRDPGNGRQMYLIISVDTAADGGSGGNATTQFALVSDSSETPAVNGTQTTHFLTAAYTAAQLALGAQFCFPLPISGLAYERFLGVQIVTATEGEDALRASAFLSLDPVGWQALPEGNR